MKLNRLFTPLKIVLETPEEVASLEWLLKKHLTKRDGFINFLSPNRQHSEQERKEHYLFSAILKACENTSKQTEFTS